MDNHPIPQDVTGFQFKLIGNMTVKQFAYLATGIVMAWILLQLPINILIKFPFSAFSAIFGIGLAYFPVSGRPMDLMIGNYIKALFRPTQFVYEKTGGQIYFPNKMPVASVKSIKQYGNALSPFPKDKLKIYLESYNAKPQSKVDEKENNFLMSVSNLTASTPVNQPNVAPNLSITPIQKQPIAPAITPAPPNVITQAPPADPTLLTSPALKRPNKAIGLPSIPDSPNLITGIIKDARGNALANILVEVKDKQGNPVRAFKTNEVGRFASATPLVNGTYTAEFEDQKGQNKFEKMTINVAGQVILPIEVISIDTREELRRSLFSPPAGGLTN